MRQRLFFPLRSLNPYPQLRSPRHSEHSGKTQIAKLSAFVKQVYSPPLHFVFALAWTLALQGALVVLWGASGSVRFPLVARSASFRGLGWDCCLETITLFLMLFFLRGVDEWKDFTYDQKFNPDRPLVTGQTSFHDLASYLVGTGALILALNVPWMTGRSWVPFFILSLDLFYGSLLILLEKKSSLIREGLLLNLVFTYPVNIALSFYIYQMTQEKWSLLNPSPFTGIPVVAAFIFAFLNYEFARKISWPHHAPIGKRLYSAVLGPLLATALSLIFGIAAVSLVVLQFSCRMVPFRYLSFFPLLSWVPLIGGCWRFWKVKTSPIPPQPAAVMGPSSMIFLVIFYLSILLFSGAVIGRF